MMDLVLKSVKNAAGGLFDGLLLAEQFMPGGPDESKNGRVLQSSLNRDGVEMLLERIKPSEHLHAVLAADLLLDHRRAGENAISILTERLEGRAVVELSHNVGPQPTVDQPLVEQSSKHGAGRWEEQGGAV